MNDEDVAQRALGICLARAGMLELLFSAAARWGLVLRLMGRQSGFL